MRLVVSVRKLKADVTLTVNARTLALAMRASGYPQILRQRSKLDFVSTTTIGLIWRFNILFQDTLRRHTKL